MVVRDVSFVDYRTILEWKLTPNMLIKYNDDYTAIAFVRVPNALGRDSAESRVIKTSSNARIQMVLHERHAHTQPNSIAQCDVIRTK